MAFSGDVSTTDIVRLTIVRFLIATIFLIYLLVVRGADVLPVMVDQERYITDIAMVEADLSASWASGELYSTNRTLYSRAVGFVAWIMPFDQPEIVPALFVNTICGIFTALLCARLFRKLGGDKPRLVFWCVGLSPSLMAYSLFAIRDIAIVAVSMLFLESLVRYRTGRMVLIGFTMNFLRPFQVAIFGMWWYLFRTSSPLRQRRRGSTILTSTVALGAMFVGVGVVAVFFAPPSFLNYAQRGIDWARIGLNAAGLEAFAAGDAGVRVSTAQNAAARILMFDSVVLPLYSLYVAIISTRRLAAGDSRWSSGVQFLSMIILTTSIGIAYTYLAVQDGLAFRKILVLVPIMWVLVLLHRSGLTSIEEAKERGDYVSV